MLIPSQDERIGGETMNESEMSAGGGQVRRTAIGVQLRRVRRELRGVTDRAKFEARRAAADGVPETLIARDLGVARGTVRNWIMDTRGGDHDG